MASIKYIVEFIFKSGDSCNGWKMFLFCFFSFFGLLLSFILFWVFLVNL